MNEPPLLDAAVLDNLIEHIGGDGARAVIGLFLGECRELAAEIVAPGADTDAVRRAAHSLKSSAGQLGAMALAKAAAQVEEAAGAGSAALADHIGVLADYATRTEAVLAARFE
jgi:HPt (histidine-containing phosphotransfer) domain-containing protein